MRWIAQNAGEEGNMVVAKVRDLESETGFNAASQKYENLTDAGVIDPTKVVRFAIQNASSIAGLMLTTEAVVAEIPEKKKDAPMPPGGGGMEDY
jgi:chaperonin GroEL